MRGFAVSDPPVRPAWNTSPVADNPLGDRMDLTRDPSTIASAAAEEIRTLNHRTLNTSVFTQPAQVSDTAFGISTTLERLPQTLDQLDSALTQLRLDGRIRLVSKPVGATTQQDVTTEVAAATSALSEARRSIRQAHTAMQQATNILANLGGLWEDDEVEASA